MGAPVEPDQDLVRVVVDDTTDSESVEVETTGGSDSETTSKSEAAPAADKDGSSVGDTTDKEEDLSITETGAKSVLEAAGLSLADFTAEYSEKGELSEESMSKLVNEAGIPRDIVEGYIAGQESLAQQASSSIVDKAYDLAGSKEQYQTLVDWAANNFTEAEQSAFNDSVNSLDEAKTDQAVRGLIQRYQASEGYEGSTVSGSVSSSSNADVYQDKSSLLSDLGDARYKTSASFRSMVDSKALRSMKRHGGAIPS